MEMRDRVKAAGVTVEEFGSLCGVSRVAVYRWFDGNSPDKLRKRRVGMVLSALDRAVEAKDLPLDRPSTRKIDKEVVLQKIKDIVIRHLKELTEVG